MAHTSLAKLKNEMERRLETPQAVTRTQATQADACTSVCSSDRQTEEGKGEGNWRLIR